MLKEKLEYEKYINLRDINLNKVNKIATFRMISFLVLLFSFILKYYYYPYIFQTLFIISTIIFIILVIIHNKYFKLYNYYESYLQIIEEYLKREDGTWKQFEDNAIEFLNDSNQYLSDLDILGERSLFQYINITKTLGGKLNLIKKLSNPKLSEKELKEQQSSILELSNNINFCIDFQTKIKYYEKKEINLSKDYSDFKIKKEGKKRDLYISIIASIICISLLILGIFNILSMKYFYGMFIFNYLISTMYSYIYIEEFNSITKLIQNYTKLKDIMILVLNQSFTSPKLEKIKQKMQKGQEGYIELSYIDTINSLKANLISSFIFNGFFCLNLLLLYRFSNFTEKSFNKIEQSINDIEELESMISLANIGILRREKTMPIYQEELGISFQELKHPLLDENICIPNDFDSINGIKIITGSNMGGKTSFLRTIGINLILMNAGTFTCATNFKSSYFKIVTSMRVSDDIEKGISTFYGELLRIKEAINYVGKTNLIVLIDEIFKGTNYQDRIYGAKEVLKKLNNKKTLVFLTTHDFELCEEKYVTNYHVKEEYEGDKIIFDYKIRKGQCTSTNAKYLMKKLGIIETKIK